jgi:N-acetylglutamate synthase-like GNAT family acetyltransferase
MISKCTTEDFEVIYSIINDAAIAYKGIIPADRWHEPYMSKEELQQQISEGVEFWCYQEEEQILGVMGIQFKGEVTLIRHAYVRTNSRNKGIGKKTASPFVVDFSHTHFNWHVGGRCLGH